MQTYEVHTDVRREQATAVCDGTVTVAELGLWLARTYRRVVEAVAAQEVEIVGLPFARFHVLDRDRFAVEAGFPVARLIADDGAVHASWLPGGPAAITVHTGLYDDLQPAYEALAVWVAANDGEPDGDAWEIYHSDPDDDPTTWWTEIVQPYRAALDADRTDAGRRVSGLTP